MRNVIKNAIDCGYVVRQRINNPETGQFEWVRAVFLDKDEARKFLEEQPWSDEPATENPATENPATENPSMAINIDKEYKIEENKVKKDKKRESTLSKTDLQVELNFSEPPHPEPQQPQQSKSSLPAQTSHTTSLSPLFSNSEKSNKAEKYKELHSGGVKLQRPELREWAIAEMGDTIKTYRRSGYILTGGNDVSSEFAIYVARQNCPKGQEPTIALGFNVINKCEQDPLSWQKLVCWVVEWQSSRSGGSSITSRISDQERSREIEQALKTKFEL
jgi:hypothetical protein